MGDFEARERTFVSWLVSAYSEDLDYFQHVLDVLGSYKGDCPQTLNLMGKTLFQQNPALLEQFFILFPWAQHPEGLGEKESNRFSIKTSYSSLSSSSNEVFPPMFSSITINKENEALVHDSFEETIEPMGEISDVHDTLDDKKTEVQLSDTNEEVNEDTKCKNELTCLKCNKVFEAKRYLKAHNNRIRQGFNCLKNGTEIISCPDCKTQFKAKKYLTIHIRLQRCNGNTGTECPECKMQFKSREYLRRHIKSGVCQEKIKRITCPKCEKIFKNKKSLSHHINLKRCKAGIISCTECKTRFKNKIYLKEHIRLQRCKKKTETISCPKCKKQLKNKDSLRKHIRLQRCKKKKGAMVIQKEPAANIQKIMDENIPEVQVSDKNEEVNEAVPEIISCLKCKKQFKAKKYLREHIRLERCSQESKTFECLKCESSFQKLGHLLQHNKKNVNCQEKKKTTDSSKKNVNAEEAISFDKTDSLKIIIENYAKCTKCLKDFATKDSLKKHLNICTEYQCKHCDQVFDARKKMRWHRDKVHSTQSPKCAHCMKQFGTKEALVRHLKICHSNSKEILKCNICSISSFENALDLSVHLGTVHNRVCCDHCKSNFANAQCLRNHYEVVHMKKRDYSCDQCDLIFSQKGVLYDHIRDIHLQLWSFPCLECEKKGIKKGFKRKLYWQIHMKNHHSDVDIDACYDAAFKEDFLSKMAEEEDENRVKLESSWEKIRETVWDEEWEDIGQMLWESE